jgi:hypothetical protein
VFCVSKTKQCGVTYIQGLARARLDRTGHQSCDQSLDHASYNRHEPTTTDLMAFSSDPSWYPPIIPGTDNYI